MHSTGLERLKDLQRRIIDCRACPRLVAHRERVGREKRRAYRHEDYWAKPVPSFGDPRAGLFIVGLAPAAHGANRTGRMFTGDRSGQWLYRALFDHGFCSRPASVGPDDGLELHGAYISAAAHCAPPDNKLSAGELRRCRNYLDEELGLFIESKQRRLVLLALGAVAFRACLLALDALGRRRAGKRPRFAHMAEAGFGPELALLASYHPSQQNTQTGRLTREMFDAVFARARELL